MLFGVTGGIGSGKTAVCACLKVKNIPIIEADPLARELTQTVPEIRDELVATFGQDLFSACGDLNKEELAKLVFSDVAAREQINRIIHPHVLNAIREQAEEFRLQGNQLVGVEAALIYESGMQEMLDAVVVVDAPLGHRMQWIQERNHLTVAEATKRIDSQMPVEQKVARADYVLLNNGSLIDLSRKVDELHLWLSAKEKSSS